MLVDFLRAFGGERLVQAAWGETILEPCPALDGTEADPHSALRLAHANAGYWLEDDDTASSPTPPGFPSPLAGHGIGAVDTHAGDVAKPPRARTVIYKPYEMAQEEWDLLGPDAQPIQQQQVQCLLQGMRLLVTLLTDQHTWQPVSLSACHPLCSFRHHCTPCSISEAVACSELFLAEHTSFQQGALFARAGQLSSPCVIAFVEQAVSGSPLRSLSLVCIPLPCTAQ